MFPELDLYYADPAQPLVTAGEELDDLNHDLPEVWEKLREPEARHTRLWGRYRTDNIVKHRTDPKILGMMAPEFQCSG